MTREEQLAAAYVVGANAYPDTATWECPYPEGTEEREAWLLGRSIESETMEDE